MTIMTDELKVFSVTKIAGDNNFQVSIANVTEDLPWDQLGKFIDKYIEEPDTYFEMNKQGREDKIEEQQEPADKLSNLPEDYPSPVLYSYEFTNIPIKAVKELSEMCKEAEIGLNNSNVARQQIEKFEKDGQDLKR